MTADYEHTPVSVEDKTAVVVGGTSGIGKAISLGFAADGADVIPTSRTEEDVEIIANSIRDFGADTIEITCDIADSKSIESMCDAVFNKFGDIDILVNSAVANIRKGIFDITMDDWNYVLETQLSGVFDTTKIFASRMNEASIINISSLTTNNAISNLIPYSAAKGGIDAFTRAAAKELGPNIRVNAIRPGFILTPLTEAAYGEGTRRRQRIKERTYFNRIGKPDDLVGAAIYLASDAAGYVSGEIITVDGGFTDSAFE